MKVIKLNHSWYMICMIALSCAQDSCAMYGPAWKTDRAGYCVRMARQNVTETAINDLYAVRQNVSERYEKINSEIPFSLYNYFSFEQKVRRETIQQLVNELDDAVEDYLWKDPYNRQNGDKAWHTMQWQLINNCCCFSEYERAFENATMVIYFMDRQ